MAGAEQYSSARRGWQRPAEFDVPPDVIDALRTRWDMWTQPQLPDELAALITDDVLDQFVVAGTYDEIVGKIKERFGGICTRVGFSIPVRTPEDEQLLKSVVRELQT
jgi:hypothetical protein